MNYARGRDLSKYDPPKNGPAVDYSEFQFYIIRVFDGTDPDPKFTEHKTKTKAKGKLWWPYAFYDWFYWARPQVQAALKLLGDDPGCLPLVFDVERWLQYKYPPRLNLLAGMHDLYDEYKKMTGKLPQFYMNAECIHYLKPLPSWLTDCNLWIAYWRGLSQPDFEPFPHWEFWQYHGEPDQNYFNGTIEELQEICKPPGPAPLTIEERLKRLEDAVFGV